VPASMRLDETRVRNRAGRDKHDDRARRLLPRPRLQHLEQFGGIALLAKAGDRFAGARGIAVDHHRDALRGRPGPEYGHLDVTPVAGVDVCRSRFAHRRDAIRPS
jgi:hypothetical protein